MLGQTLLILGMAIVYLLIGKDFLRTWVVLFLLFPFILFNCLEYIETIMFLL